jgi:hypothetical protein
VLVEVWKSFTSATGLGGIIYSWIFPSAAFVVGLWLLPAPDFESLAIPYPFNGSDAWAPLWRLLGLATLIGVVLGSVATQLSRILEGYLFWPRCLQTKRIERQRQQKTKFREEYERLLADQARQSWEVGLVAEKLRRFPEDDKQIAPTRFGNALRALETYGVTHYQFDSQMLWSELVSVAPDELKGNLTDAANRTNFFVAFVYLGFVFAVVSLAVGLIEHWRWYMFWWPIAGVVVSSLAYVLAILSVDNWRDGVHAIVNLCRRKVADEMGLATPATLAEEREMWLAVRRFVLAASQEHCRSLDQYRKRTSAAA